MNTPDPFERLAPFIQTYIYQNRWTDLRAIQKAAIPALLDTSDHVLIMSGTASGKTEAAMLPALTILEQSPAQSVGILYIGPLKALINDQFERIQSLLQHKPDIPIQGWHGDIAYSQKKRFLQKPRGVLQITPESMEALFVNRPGELRTIFGDVRFIIIDEIHAFLGTERGQQVLCHLQRMERSIGRPVRRIGLSATIGDTAIALRWLESGSQFRRSARLVTEPAHGRSIELRVNHIVTAPVEKNFHATMAPEEIGIRRRRKDTPTPHTIQQPDEGTEAAGQPDKRRELQQDIDDYYDDLFALTSKHQKTLIFTNRRAVTERIAAELRQRLAKVQPARDWYFVHHSSIAADLREAAEEKMRDVTQQTCTVATASLELGIDIGHLDLVVQVGAPYTVSSFVQRLGRSGRRGTPSRMCFYTLEHLDNEKEYSSELEQIPWDFLQTIAIIQLYLEEQWIEPPVIPTMPLSLLYQQTMSILLAHTELTPARMAQLILTLSPFQVVSLDDYRLFLRHLIAIDQIAQMEEGTLIVGMKGEQLTSHYHFYAIFANEQAWRVLAGTQEVGTVQQRPEPGSVIGLAGYAWRVISVNERGQTVYVERARGAVQPNWQKYGGIQYHEHVMQRLRQVLQENTVYSYLSPRSQQRLTFIRELAHQSDWLRSSVVRIEPGRFALFPWTSSRVFNTLVHLLRYKNWYARQPMSGFHPYMEVVYDGDAGAVIAELRNLSSQVPELIQELVSELKESQLWHGKYDYLTPRTLLEKAYVNDVLDIPGTIQWLTRCS